MDVDLLAFYSHAHQRGAWSLGTTSTCLELNEPLLRFRSVLRSLQPSWTRFRYVRDNRRKAFMICPIWRELEARFVRAAKAIEENDERLPGGSERNRQLNAAARAAAQKLRRTSRNTGASRTETMLQQKVSGGGRSSAPNQSAQKRIRFVNCVRSRRFLFLSVLTVVIAL